MLTTFLVRTIFIVDFRISFFVTSDGAKSQGAAPALCIGALAADANSTLLSAAA